MTEVINICYACDDYYSVQLGISLLSLLKYNSNIRIFLIDTGISKRNLHNIIEICKKYNAGLNIIRPNTFLSKISDNNYLSPVENNSIATFVRLYLGNFIPSNVKKIIYLDCDTIINGSLRKLYNVSFIESIAAVIDANFDFYFTLRNGYQKGNYFNAGMLLINLDAFSSKIDASKNEIKNILDTRPILADQDCLNLIFKDDFYKLPPIYNASINYRLLKPDKLKKWMNWDISPYSDVELYDAYNNPLVIHYTSSVLGRPWEANCMDPETNQWRKYYLESPWKNIDLKKKNNTLKNILARTSFKLFPLGLYMKIEYLYFKHKFLSTKNLNA